MRNLQKILALVLALIMSFSLVATAGAFSDDGDISESYQDAVTVLNGLEVFKGYSDGTFAPKGNITRAEVAAIIYRIATGDVNDTQASIYSTWGMFTDVADGSWYSGYVNYCANAGYIKGRGNKIFDPQGQVTGYEALAMILRAVGYDKNGEFTGSNWQVRTASIANERHITDNVSSALLGQAATREMVAEILFRSIIIPKVNFNANTLSYTEVPDKDGKKQTLAYESLKMEEIEGVVTANEYADLEAEEPLSANRTRMDVNGVDYTLEYKSDLDYLGESRIAYVQNLTGSKIVNNVLLLSDTGDNVVYDEGKEIDTKDAAAEKSIKLNDDTTQYFINYDPIDEYKAEWRIEYVYKWTTNTYDAVDLVRFNEGTLNNLTTGEKNVTRDLTDTKFNALDRTQAYDFEYTKVITVGKFLTPTDISLISKIFSRADYQNGTYDWGEVYVGTSSIVKDDDISDDISYREFVNTYLELTDNEQKVEENTRGNRLKVIDNNNDGVVEYVLQTKYTVTTVATMNSDGKFTLESKNYKLDAKDIVNEIDNDTKYVKEDGSADFAANDVVLYAVIDGNARTEKAETLNAKIDKVNRTNGEVTTTDGTTYEDSDICAHAEHYNDNPKEMAGNTNYNLYFDKYGYLAAFNEAEEAFVLLVDGWYNRVKGGDEYAVKTWQDGKLQTVDVTANGDLFIDNDGSENNNWTQIRTLGGPNNNMLNADKIDRPVSNPATDDIHTAVAMLSSDGVLTPVDMAYHTLKQSYIIAMNDDELPGRVDKRGQIFTTIANATNRTAYNKDGDANVDVRALSSTVYYFVYNALSGNRTITQVVREYVGYQNLPNTDYVDYIEDVYAVGTKQTSSVNSNYYTAEVVVVELNDSYYNTLGGEQVFIPRFPIAGTNVTLEEVKLVRENGAFEDVTIDLSRSDLRYYDIADGTDTNANSRSVAAGLYRMWKVSDSDNYYVRYMSADEIEATDRYYVGMVDYNTGTGARNYTTVDLYGRDKNDIGTVNYHAKATGEKASALNLDTTKYYTYKGDELTESDRDTVMIQTPVADRSRTDTCGSWQNETKTNNGYQRNEVLIAYDRANTTDGEERIAYAISFNEYDSWDSPISHVHDAAQTVWDVCTPNYDFGGVVPPAPDTDAEKVAAAMTALNGMDFGTITVPADETDAVAYVRDQIVAAANVALIAAGSDLTVTAADVTLDNDLAGLTSDAPVADVVVTIALASGDASDSAAGSVDVEKEEDVVPPEEYTITLPAKLTEDNSAVLMDGTRVANGDTIYEGATIELYPAEAFIITSGADENGVVTGDVTVEVANGFNWSDLFGAWIGVDPVTGDMTMYPYNDPTTAAAGMRARAADDGKLPVGIVDTSIDGWQRTMIRDVGATYTITVGEVMWESTIGAGKVVWSLKKGTPAQAVAAVANIDTAVVEKTAAAPDDEPEPETGTVHASVYKYLTAGDSMQLKAADGEWRLESDLPIVDGMVTIQVVLQSGTGNKPYIKGTTTGVFKQNNDKSWTATIPASNGDSIVISTVAASAGTVTMTQGRNVAIMGADKNGQLAIPFVVNGTAPDQTYDSVSFRVTIPAGSVPQVTIDKNSATASVKQVNDTTWDVIVAPTAAQNFTGEIRCTQNVPKVTIGKTDSRVEITDAPETAPAGTYVLKLTTPSSFEPKVDGATVSNMDCAESDGKLAWTVTLTGITGDVTLNVALVDVQSMEIKRGVYNGATTTGSYAKTTENIALETSYAGMRGRVKLVEQSNGTYIAEFDVCVKGTDQLLSESQHQSINGNGVTVKITPAGYEYRQDGATSKTGQWGKWHFKVSGLTDSAFTDGFVVVRLGDNNAKNGDQWGQIKTIAKNDPSIEIVDQFAFSISQVGNTPTAGDTAKVSFKVKTDGTTIPDVVAGTNMTFTSKTITKTPVANEWEITLVMANAKNQPTSEIMVVPLLMPQINLIDKGDSITIAGGQPVYAQLQNEGGKDYFTATFNYTKPAGNGMAAKVYGVTPGDELRVSGVTQTAANTNGTFTETTIAASNVANVVVSDGATSGTVTVRVECQHDATGATLSAPYAGLGRNYILMSNGYGLDTLPKDGKNPHNLITAYVDSHIGYEVELLPAENGEFTINSGNYKTVSDKDGVAIFTIMMDNSWEILEDDSYEISKRHAEQNETEVTIKVTGVDHAQPIRLKFEKHDGPAYTTYTATSQNIANANLSRPTDGNPRNNEYLFSPEDDQFDGNWVKPDPSDSTTWYTQHSGSIRNGHEVWNILTDPGVEPIITAKCAGYNVDVIDVEFVGVTERAGDSKKVLEWKVSTKNITEDMQNLQIDFRTSGDVLMASGSGSTLLGMDKKVYDGILWGGREDNAINVGDKLNGAYKLTLTQGTKPRGIDVGDVGRQFAFIVFVREGFEISEGDSYIVGGSVAGLTGYVDAYEYNNNELTMVPEGYHAMVVTVESETPITALTANCDVVLVAKQG